LPAGLDIGVATSFARQSPFLDPNNYQLPVQEIIFLKFGESKIIEVRHVGTMRLMTLVMAMT
jgi:hypothetical protein